MSIPTVVNGRLRLKLRLRFVELMGMEESSLLHEIQMKRILIVDDEENLSQMFKDEFEELGYAVDLINTGDKAITYLKIIKPSMVILDINLPDINGVVVLQQIKNEYPDIPVIMCTAYSQFEKYYQRFTDINCEFYSYLTKPVSLEKMISEVKKAIGDA